MDLPRPDSDEIDEIDFKTAVKVPRSAIVSDIATPPESGTREQTERNVPCPWRPNWARTTGGVSG